MCSKCNKEDQGLASCSSSYTTIKNEDWFLDSISWMTTSGHSIYVPLLYQVAFKKGNCPEERSLLQGINSYYQGLLEVKRLKPKPNLIFESHHSSCLDRLCHEELPTNPEDAKALLEKYGAGLGTYCIYSSAI